MAASRSGVPIAADTAALSQLAKDLRKAAPKAWKACRVGLRAAAQPVLETARANASAPGPKPGSRGAPRTAASLRIVVTAGGNVKIVGGGDPAPAAAAIENQGRGFVRHPVGGNRENWTSKNSRPAFLAPALEKHREQALGLIEKAVTDAVEAAIKGR